MHLTIWFVHSFPANAFSVSIVGFAYGPIFPGNMGQAHEVLPEELRMISMAIMYVDYAAEQRLHTNLDIVGVRLVASALVSVYSEIERFKLLTRYLSALFPFVTGTLSNFEGPQTFIYIIVAETATLLCLWCFCPSTVTVSTTS